MYQNKKLTCRDVVFGHCSFLAASPSWLLKVLLRSKNIFISSSDFETLFTKQSPCEILGLNFEKKTVYSNSIFRFNGPPLLHQKGYNDVIYLECSV